MRTFEKKRVKTGRFEEKCIKTGKFKEKHVKTVKFEEPQCKVKSKNFIKNYSYQICGNQSK